MPMATTTPVQFDAIPHALKALPQWVLWRREERNGKLTKVPYNATTRAQASVTNETDWATFGQATAICGQYDGIGFVLTASDPFTGIDLDHCLDQATGQIEPWALAIVDQLHSYTERSPSGTGLRIFVLGKLPPGRRRKGSIEFYDTERYLTLTGNHLPNTPLSIEDRHATLQLVHAEHFPPPPRNENRQRNATSIAADDATQLKRMFASKHGTIIKRLMDGNWNGDYPSQSEADAALCCHLVFWLGRDPERIDRLFRRSGLMREKWDTPRGGSTYGADCIASACAMVRETYQAPLAKGSVRMSDGTHCNNTIGGNAQLEEALKKDDAKGNDDTKTTSRNSASDQPWPVIDPAAFHGAIGNFVKAVEPYSEADPVGLLLHTLQGFGCLIGRGPHVMVEHLAHHARLNVLLVGKTANARKGTAWSTPKLMLKKIDGEWVKNRVRSGLSSGEGLIYNVRDAEGDDPGEPDKRLLIIEQEFAGALKAMQREGNTLSARIRDAWDHGTLTPMTKRDRLTVTDAHICIMGHITVTELLRLLTETEQVNGFANRFLIPLVKRSKFLPSGQGAPLSLLNDLLSPLSRITARAKERGELKRDAEAEVLWAKVYPKLEQEIPGIAGSILARGAAQVLRLSLLYCLSDLDEADMAHPAIRVPHLLAALAVWDYCKASVLHIFGDAIGDPVADRLLRLLKTGPQTGNDLYEAMGKHGGARDRKEHGLELLARLDLAHAITIPTGGRPMEEWHYGSAHACETCAKRGISTD